MATTRQVMTGTVATGGGKVLINIDAEFTARVKGDVTGSSDNVCRARVMIEVQRNGSVIARKQFGQFINELFDLTEISNMGIVVDTPPAGSQTYTLHAWVDQVQGSSNSIGFIPEVSTITMVVTELKR